MTSSLIRRVSTARVIASPPGSAPLGRSARQRQQHVCCTASSSRHAGSAQLEQHWASSGSWRARAASLCLAGVLAGSLPLPAAAAIPLGPGGGSEDAQRAWALSQLADRYAMRSTPRAPEPEPTSVRIQRLQQLMQAGNTAADAGDYEAALANYEAVVAQFPDFATTEYARLARGKVLYQLGRTSDAILQLEDLEVTLRGYAEVHAALAAVLYVERPVLLQAAEQQWEIAMEFNRQFSDPKWVADTKHWPPRLMAALDRFLNLK